MRGRMNKYLRKCFRGQFRTIMMMMKLLLHMSLQEKGGKKNTFNELNKNKFSQSIMLMHETLPCY